MYNVHLLPASFGDSILIEYGKSRKSAKYIMIDGGPYHNYKHLDSAIKSIAPQLKKLELLIITHIDIDHIDGIVKLLNSKVPPFEIEEVWFNGYRQITDVLGALQGEYLSELINKKKLVHNKSFKGKAVVVADYNRLPGIKLKGGMKLTLLSPSAEALQKLVPVWEKEIIVKLKPGQKIGDLLEEDSRYDSEILGGSKIEEWQKAEEKEDKSAANGSSIAFIGSFDGKECLFAGDATSDYLLKAVDRLLEKKGKQKLRLNAWKLAHHGSKKSNLSKLMKKIDCKTLMVSTDGKHYKHPDPECIAKLIEHNGPDLTFYFNYLTKYNKFWKDSDRQKRYNYKAVYPNTGAGISIQL